ncbi:hypothetical protein U9M48_003969 [Paspalum notatum var. saurae]|uniref:Uncharacterized protein n=1 Tax=Paspalum notatum var. saurae TaxID=547442 RepID=A0AAQ3PTR4_PASNO
MPSPPFELLPARREKSLIQFPPRPLRPLTVCVQLRRLAVPDPGLAGRRPDTPSRVRRRGALPGKAGGSPARPHLQSWTRIPKSIKELSEFTNYMLLKLMAVALFQATMVREPGRRATAIRAPSRHGSQRAPNVESNIIDAELAQPVGL